MVILIPGYLEAQDFSNKGKEFWIAYPAHIDGTGSVMGVYITSEVSTTGTLKAGTQVFNFSVTANQVTKIFLGPNGGGDVSNIPVYLSNHNTITTNAGIQITAQKDIIVYSHIIRAARSGATLVLPTKVWGREYVVPSFKNFGSGGASAGYGEIAVMASLPNTTIEITPSITGRNNAPAASVPFLVTLENPGDVYFFQGPQHADISGTLVKSVRNGNEPCKPIAVFSASTWTGLDCVGASGGDNLFQQLFPTGAWGKSFVTAPFIDRPYDVIRVYTRSGGVIINKTENGITTQLTNYNNAGRFYEYSTNKPTFIEASEPVQLAQFIVSQTCGGGQSDPEMIMLNPIDQTLNNITVFSAHENYVPTNQTQVKTHYLNIIIPTDKKNTLKIDNASPNGNFVNIPGTSYSYIQANVTSSSLTNPVHNIKADTGFIALAYGYGNVESYGYNAGTNVIDRYQYVTLKNEFATVNFPATCKGTPFNFSMTFPYQPAQIAWQFNGLFNDVTDNAPVADSTWIINGKRLYQYNLPGSYTIQNTGIFPIKVIAQNPTADGCEGEQEIDYEIQVFEKPIPSFDIVSDGCLANPVSFKNTTAPGDRPVIKYWWDYGDGQTSESKDLEHTYQTAGTYTVKHTMITDVGCLADTSYKTVTIVDPPIAKFKTEAPYCIGQDIRFVDESTSPSGAIAKWTWDFGDGSPLVIKTTNEIVTHHYATAGNYLAKLFVETSSGCKSETFQEQVMISPNPVAAFEFGNACLPEAKLQFTNKSFITTGDENLFAYQWTFGDGGMADVKDPEHTFISKGPFDVKLVVQSSDGCKGEVTQTVNTIYDQPIAGFNSPDEICLGSEISFTDNSTAPNNIVTSWQWDFGDGSSSVLQNPKKIYSSAGTYQIKLIATSGLGCISIPREKTVIVNPLPVADFNLIAPFCLNQDIQFKDASEAMAGNIIEWNWNFGDGNSRVLNSSADLIYKYASAAEYQVSLMVKTNKGCISAEKKQPIIISSFPTVNFGLPESCLDDPFSLFTDSSTIEGANANGLTYSWNFGDPNANGSNPNTSSLKDAKHTYTATGNYNVMLTVSSEQGCVASATKPFTINGRVPKADFTFVQGNEICSNEEVVITNKSVVDFGQLQRIEIYWDYANDPSLKTIDEEPVFGKEYMFNYSSFGAPATKELTIRMVSYSGENCLSTEDKILMLKARPELQLIEIPGICADAPSLNLLANEINGVIGSGIFSGQGISNEGLFDPSLAGTGHHTIRYTFTGNNDCSNYIETIIPVYQTPTVNAGPDKFVLEGGITTLEGSATGDNLSFNWTPADHLDNAFVLKPKASPGNDVLYQIKVTSSEGCSASDEVLVKVLEAPIIPNVFTPNGDGKNDTWQIPALESYPGNRVDVYNRYGQVIFSSAGYSIPWDGRYKGKEAPAGTYYYIIDPKNGRKPMSGFVDVIR